MSAAEGWAQAAERVADAVGAPAGGLVALRDRAGRPEAVDAIVAALGRRGVAVLVEHVSDAVLGAVLRGSAPELLAGWGRQQARLLETADGVVSLDGGTALPVDGVPLAAQAALRAGRAVMEEVERRRALPFVAVAVPGPGREALDDQVLAALAVPHAVIAAEVRRVRAALVAVPDPRLVLRTRGCELHLDRGERPLLSDDGRGSGVTNLPCGSVYAAVLEDRTEGTLRVPEIAGARDVVLRFAGGQAVAAEGEGAEAVLSWLWAHGGDAGRVSHLGVGLNPAVVGGTGWTLLDEHRVGAVFLALGENRYLGGTNASTLNHDLALDHATLLGGAGPAVLVVEDDRLRL